MFASTRNFSQTLAGAAGTLLFAGLCIAGATAPAQAQTPYTLNETGHRVAQVSYADLDLNSSAGRARLENRLRSAAKTVCHSSASDPWAKAEEYRCVQDTLKATRNATMAAIQAEKVTG